MLGVLLAISVDYIQNAKMIRYGMGGTVFTFHPSRNTFSHRIEETGDSTGEQHPALSTGDVTTGSDTGHQPLFCLDLVLDLKAIMRFQINR